jgi:hypothetical protein
LRPCKYLHERNYDDLGNMRSSAPRKLVCLSAMGYAWRVRGVNCA